MAKINCFKYPLFETAELLRVEVTLEDDDPDLSMGGIPVLGVGLDKNGNEFSVRLDIHTGGETASFSIDDSPFHELKRIESETSDSLCFVGVLGG